VAAAEVVAAALLRQRYLRGVHDRANGKAQCAQTPFDGRIDVKIEGK
jgi:hypothetical protein